MKRTKELEEIRGLTTGDLEERAQGLRKELMNLRFRKASGQLDNAGRMSVTRKQIARISTVLRERELKAQRDEAGKSAN